MLLHGCGCKHAEQCSSPGSSSNESEVSAAAMRICRTPGQPFTASHSPQGSLGPRLGFLALMSCSFLVLPHPRIPGLLVCNVHPEICLAYYESPRFC